jgi:hypothetical protein
MPSRLILGMKNMSTELGNGRNEMHLDLLWMDFGAQLSYSEKITLKAMIGHLGKTKSSSADFVLPTWDV